MTDQTDLTDRVVTADDVATAAGVSRWTVGRAFRKDASISEKSRKKVMSAAKSLGYLPDLLAASLASDRSNLVALLCDDFDNPHKLLVLERLSRVFREEGWGTLLVNMRDASDAPSALLAASQRRVDAAVLNGTWFDGRVMRAALGARRVRKLIVFARTSESPDTISICCDDVGALREIARYADDRGYRSPIFVAGPDTHSAILRRKETFLGEWKARHGRQPPCIHVDHYSIPLARARVREALPGLAAARRPDLLVCENDALAIGAMDALRHDLGLAVPGDVAVIGFDDVGLASSPAYDLTTWRQPLDAMAAALVDVLRADHEPSGEYVFPGELVRRGSA
ncbi:MAG: LacI family DNA-binding transcriptional regulator [Hyphomicrobiales bacterium]|nr:LacI family DNA-binding transcriptional regulator [Hyphomicrobiales bacterium]MDE2017052.1 LacI family DNA-binding transcriptional regulator [Hyphomicrobiales bacterium]